MTIIQMEIDKLVSRGQEVRTMLQPIARRSGGPAWERNNVTSREFIIAT